MDVMAKCGMWKGRVKTFPSYIWGVIKLYFKLKSILILYRSIQLSIASLNGVLI